MSLPVLFGANVDPIWEDPGYPARLTRLAERGGLDLVAVQDHPYMRTSFESWTLIATLAAQTQRIRFVTDVVNLPLRPPALLAKAAATLDVLSGGRVELGLGSGAFADAIEAFGGPRRSRAEAFAALREAVEVIRLMWSDQQTVGFSGAHYRIAGVHPGPRPAHPIGIWLGVSGPRGLSLVGEKADGWLPSLRYLGLDDLGEAIVRVDVAAEVAGRDPAAIRKVYNVNGIIGPESSVPFQGSVEQWVDLLLAVTDDYGMNGYIYWPETDHERQIEIFAGEVVPTVRQALS